MLIILNIGYLPNWLWPFVINTFVWNNGPLWLTTIIINYVLIYVLVRFLFQVWCSDANDYVQTVY